MGRVWTKWHASLTVRVRPCGRCAGFGLCAAFLRPGLLGVSGFVAILAACASVFARPADAAPGALDPSWGRGGIATAPFPGLDAELISIARLSGGGVVAAGRIGAPSAMARGAGQVALARFLPSGRLDRSFGRGGIVRTRLTGRDRVVRVVAQNDGRVLVVVLNGYRPHYDFGRRPVRVLRYRRNGSLDRSYGGGDGIASVSVGRPVVRDAVALPGGRLALLVPGRPGHLLVGLSARGRVERVVATPVRQEISYQEPALAPTPHGGVLLAGARRSAAPFVGRYDRRLRLVRTYGAPARARLAPTSAAVGRDGSIVLAGRDEEQPGESSLLSGVVLVRYRPDGRPDAHFGASGVVSLPLRSDNDAAEHYVHLCVLASGAIVVAGVQAHVIATRVSDEGTYLDAAEPDVAVYRLTASGQPDASFAPDGETRFDVTPEAAMGTAVAGLAIAPDGRIVIGATPMPEATLDPARRSAFSVVRLRGGARPAAALSLRLRQVDESGAELPCGDDREHACQSRLGEPMRIAGHVSPVPQGVVGAVASIRIFGAWNPVAALGYPFVEVKARVGADGRLAAAVPTRADWTPDFVTLEAHVAATSESYDVAGPLRHAKLVR